MEKKFNFNPIHMVRGFQALLALLAMALLANVAQWFNTSVVVVISSKKTLPGDAPMEIIFGIFVSVMTLLITLPYVVLVPRYFPQLFASYTKYTILAVESLTMICWFSSFIAIATFLSHLNACRGQVCNTAKAGATLTFIAWLAWGVTSFFALRFCLNPGTVTQKGAVDSGTGVTRAATVRERVVRGLRLHNVWTGHGRRDEEAATPRSYNVSRHPSQNKGPDGNGYAGYEPRLPHERYEYPNQSQQQHPWDNRI